MGTSKFEVQLKPAKPSIIIGSNHVKTSAFTVYALQSHAHISQELMLWVAPHVDDHGLKCLPANLPYDKSIRDGNQKYVQLLKEQNQYFSKYEDFRIGGINKDLLEEKIDNSAL
eukprot:2840472-Ditylum_brightwellii.AAC.1